MTDFYDALAECLLLICLFVGPLTVAAALGRYVELFTQREE